MQDLSHTPQSDLEPTPSEAAPATNPPPQQTPAGSSSGGGLKGAGITFGILSIAASVLTIVTIALFNDALNKDPSAAVGGYIVVLLFLGVWLPFGALSGLISCICVGAYISREPNMRGSALWPMLIGGLTLFLGLVTLMLYSQLGG